MAEVDASLRARILGEALPFIRHYHGSCVVAKVGGQVLVKKDLLDAFARDVSLLAMVGVRLVIVHGGGPQIAQQLAAAGIREHKVDGLRVTDEATLAVVERVLCEEVNATLVQAIEAAGTTAVGLKGSDNSLLQAEVLSASDYGLVGEVVAVKLTALEAFAPGEVPVIAPLGVSAQREVLNINADAAAAAVAKALKAKALLLLTDTDGVLDAAGDVIQELTAAEIDVLIAAGSIAAGMLLKVRCALDAVSGDVSSCRILNGTSAHPLLLDLLTDAGVGTMIVG